MVVLISVDMEGISGVVDPEQVTRGGPEYERFRRLMTQEVNAAVAGADAGGAERIIVNDAHGWMSNVLVEELNDAAELISGRPKPLGMMQGMESGVDRVFFIGYHAASGSASAVLEHTNNDRVFELQVNGAIFGELGFNAALAGFYRAPVVLVTGDSGVVREAGGLLPGAETVVVKEALGRSGARCLPPAVARERISEAAERSLRTTVAPFVVPPPVHLQVVFTRSSYAQAAAMMPGVTVKGGRTVEWEGKELDEAYRAYRTLLMLAGTV